MTSQVHEDGAGASRPGMWPMLSGALPPLPDAYVPRLESGLGLAATLAAGETTVLAPGADLARALGGHGGAGVTQVAAAVTRALLEQEVLDLAVWVTAASRDSIVTGYAQALADLGGPAADGPEQAAAQFLSWLADTDRAWLVVLDDLADAAAADGLWPRGRTGRVLAATQHPDAARRAPRPRLVEVGPFSGRESLAYLTARLHADPDQRLGSLDLAADLGFLPLALAQAAAVIAETGTDCRSYRERLAEQRSQHAAVDGRPWMVAATWTLAAGLADQSPPAGLSAPLLAILALLDPNGVPGVVLTSRACCAFAERHLGVSGVEDVHVRAALQNLARAGLITVDQASAARTVRAHSGAQAVARERLPAADGASAARAAADALVQVWPRRELPPAFEQALRDCARRLLRRTGTALWTPEPHPVLARAGRSLDRARLFGAGVAYWSAMADIGRRTLGPDHPHSIVARDRLAAALESAGQLSDAIAMHEETVADRERALGPGHPDTLAACASLARVYRADGRAPEAVRMAERVLLECERAFGPGQPDTLAARAELGHAYLAAGRPLDAVAAFQQARAEEEATLAPGRPQTPALRAGLARAHQAAGQFKEAIALFDAMLAEGEHAQGPEHPATLAARADLAGAFREAGRPRDAIPLYRRNLAEWERSAGAAHPDTLAARAALAHAYLAANKPRDAIPLLERSLADGERTRGPDHPDTLAARGALAAAYRSARRTAVAIPLFERTLADCERVLGPDHPLTRAARDSLAAATAGR